MNKVTVRVHAVHLRMQTERRVAANPQTEPIDLGCETADNWQVTSTSTIAVVIIRAVLTNGHTGHVPRAPGFFFFLWGPQLAVVKQIY